MEIIINAVLFNGIDKIDIFPIRVNTINFIVIRRKLETERYKMVEYIKFLCRNGTIKSIWRPKNKKIQNRLNNLINAKKEIDKSVYKIREVFY